MDRFLKRVAPPSTSTDDSSSTHPCKKSKPASKQGNISSAARSRDYEKGTFTVDNGRLYCRTCNILIEHTRKTTVDRHLLTKSHSAKVKNAKVSEENGRQRMETMATVIQHRTDAEYFRKKVAIDLILCDTFLKHISTPTCY